MIWYLNKKNIKWQWKPNLYNGQIHMEELKQYESFEQEHLSILIWHVKPEYPSWHWQNNNDLLLE